METDHTINQEVVAFFRKHLILKYVDENTIINTNDFTSEDAFFILDDFVKKFGIDKGYLDIDKYFQPIYPFGIGVYPFIKGVLSIVGLVKRPIIVPKSTITISHMIEVAKRKEWFDPK